MKLGVVGGGCVGRATARAFIEHVDEVMVYDVVKERATHGLQDVLACDLVMICLPTPQKPDSLACNTSYVEEFCSQAAAFHARGNYVIRSTVPVGFTRRMRERYGLTSLCHSPEFLTARCAVTDAQLPARNVVGDAADGFRCDGATLLADLYRRRFPGVPCLECSSEESELIKLATNGFFAVKIAFWNEVRQLADAVRADWGVVLAGVLADGRISHSHTKAPGPDGKYGFGGACLPKDLANLIDCVEAAGLTSYVADAAWDRNIEDRKR